MTPIPIEQIEALSQIDNPLRAQAERLLAPWVDHELTARTAGFKIVRLDDGASMRGRDVEFYAWRGERENDPEAETPCVDSEQEAWEEACALDNLSPIQRLPISIYAIDENEAQALRENGETIQVPDLKYLTTLVWETADFGLKSSDGQYAIVTTSDGLVSWSGPVSDWTYVRDVATAKQEATLEALSLEGGLTSDRRIDPRIDEDFHGLRLWACFCADPDLSLRPQPQPAAPRP